MPVIGLIAIAVLGHNSCTSIILLVEIFYLITKEFDAFVDESNKEILNA